MLTHLDRKIKWLARKAKEEGFEYTGDARTTAYNYCRYTYANGDAATEASVGSMWYSIFLNPSCPKLLAVQPSIELLQDFIGGRAPDVDVPAIVNQYGLVYIDIPRTGTLAVGEYVLDAIFLAAGVDGSAVVRMDLMNAAGAYALHWGFHEPPAAAMPVYDLIKLILAYYTTIEETNIAYLPQAGTRLSTTKVKKQRKEARNTTMFKVVTLVPPADHFGRRDRACVPKGGWKLDHRVRIRGYFRMQPYGKRKQYRRLQWIASSMKGPPDAPMKHAMHKLERAANGDNHPIN